MKSLLALLLTLPLLLPHASAQPDTHWKAPETGMTFVAIPAGCYAMGSPWALRPDRSDFALAQLGYQGLPFADEAPTHEVCLEHFWLAQHEVTAAQWQQVMGTPPPFGKDNQPAGGITWQQAQHFASTLSHRSTDQSVYRLPTEAEWEHACRLGLPPALTSRRALPQYAWYGVRKRWTPDPQTVGSLKPDQLGLHDMLGNLWEWVEDSYSAEAYQQHTRRNPRLVDDQADERVIRGGSHRSARNEIRCTSRSSYPAHQSLRQIGLRIVRVESR